MITIEQKLTALRRAVDDAREYERKTRPGYLCLPEQIDKLLAIIADYETHLPALVKAAKAGRRFAGLHRGNLGHSADDICEELNAALAHFTEAGGQVQCAACGKQSPVETVQYNRCPECGEPFEAGGQGGAG